jgi:regulator of nucleoside diphosphate kinase
LSAGRCTTAKLENIAMVNNQPAQAPRPPIVLTSADCERLFSFLKDAAMEEAPDVVRFLMEELERADIVPPGAVIASSLVRMGSEVKFVNHETDEIEQVRLVYPEQADASLGLISVLTPTGSAVLGLGPGQSISWTVADGKTRCLSVLEVYPPSGQGG